MFTNLTDSNFVQVNEETNLCQQAKTGFDFIILEEFV
jgi:hypothetical protein